MHAGFGCKSWIFFFSFSVLKCLCKVSSILCFLPLLELKIITCITNVACCTLVHFIPFRLQFYKSLKIKNSSDRKQRTFWLLVRTLLTYLLISFVRPSSGKVRQTAPCIHSLWNHTQIPATPSDMCTNSGQWALHIIQTSYSSSPRNTLSTSDGQCAGFFVFFTITAFLLFQLAHITFCFP